jgi:NADH-quinone oxidoreductase subunit N
MTLNVGTLLAPELTLFAVAVVVLIAGLIRPGRAIGWITFVGLLLVLGVMHYAQEGVLFDGAFAQDQLALFAKRLFLVASAVCLLGSLTLRQPVFDRRAAEYYFALLISLLGMLVLASARELILLFVAFELMSIPLYVLTGFLKREAVAPEAALKFFLVGTASSAIIAYGMSFVYGVTGSTALAAIPQAMRDGHPLMLLGMGLLLAGLGFKIAAFPFHMWAPDTYEGGEYAVRGVALGRTEGRWVRRAGASLRRRRRRRVA